jgi:hypothetical protein
MAEGGELGLPAGHQIADVLMSFAVPGGPGRHSPGVGGGVGADDGVDLRRPRRMLLAHLGRDAGDSEPAQPPRPAGTNPSVTVGSGPGPGVRPATGSSARPATACS